MNNHSLELKNNQLQHSFELKTIGTTQLIQHKNKVNFTVFSKISACNKYSIAHITTNSSIRNSVQFPTYATNLIIESYTMQEKELKQMKLLVLLIYINHSAFFDRGVGVK
jgi:hypothetical protein